MVNLNSSLPIDERYVEYLPSGEYGGFYQVGDGLRLVPPGIYYWSLPGEFLGERVHNIICNSVLTPSEFVNLSADGDRNL
jgi:hypothetical protein